jgi:hypothetical protein
MNFGMRGRVHSFVQPGLKSLLWPARLLVLLGLGLVTGCTSVKVVHRAPEFDSASLASGGLGIGAVAGLGGGEYFLADNVSKLLSQELAREHPGVVVLQLEQIKPLLPAAEYKVFLLDFSELMTVRVKDIELLSTIHPKTRYVLLVDIARDDVGEDESSFSEDHYRQVKNCQTGEYESEHDYTDYSVVRTRSRSVEARFIICDLEARRPVWIAIGKKGDSESNSSSSSYRTPPAPAWPSAPSSISPLEGIVAKMVRKLPR